jgi:hypothetical protein
MVELKNCNVCGREGNASGVSWHFVSNTTAGTDYEGGYPAGTYCDQCCTCVKGKWDSFTKPTSKKKCRK